MSFSKRYQASLHGHSHYSDGLSSVYDIVKTAYLQKINYLAITDHDTVAGIHELYQASHHFNQKSHHKILPIAGIELMTKQGEMIMLKPAPYSHIQDFLDWCKELILHGTPDLISTAQAAIDHHQAILIIPHPELKFIGMHATSYDTIRKLANRLNTVQRAHLGLEIHNWSANFMFSLNQHRENHVKILASELNLAQFGGADFHDSWQINQQTTTILGTRPTYLNFIQAVRQRKISPTPRKNLSLRSIFNLYQTLGRAWFKSHSYHQQKQKYHLP